MKKNLNKLATLVLTGVLMTGMSFGALADSNSNKVAGTGIAGAGSAVVFGKKIIFEDLSKNSATADVPTATYTYTIAAANGGTTTAKQTVEGKEETVTMQVEAGVEKAVVYGKKATLQFTPADKDVKTDSTGAYAVEKEVEFDFDSTKFDHAGVYRYEITEEAAGSNPTTIVKNEGYSNKRVLDVWVTNGEDGKLVISNYTLYKWEDGKTSYDANTKGPGWTDGNGSDYSSESANSANLEKFVTTDMKVEKKIKGTLANLKENFAFTISIDPVTTDEKTNSYVGMQVVTDVNGTKSVNTVDSDNKVTVTGMLTNNGTIVVYGLPSDVKYTVTEVDATKKNYVATAKTTTFTGNLDGATETNLVAGAADSEGKVTNTLTATEAVGATGKYVQVTNTLKNTTPTGVVMNIAPYAAMILGAGAFAGVFLGRKKSEDEE